MDNTLRAFIAVDISPEIRKELIRIQSELKNSLKGNISWVEPENIHLTLRFLGQITDKQLEEIKKRSAANTIKYTTIHEGKALDIDEPGKVFPPHWKQSTPISI